MKSKTIILSQENSSGRGILTLYVEDDLLKAKLRLYQVEKLNDSCKLAVYHKQQVFSANLIFKNGAYLSSLVGDWDMDEDFYTALVDVANNNSIILSGGSYAGYFFEDNGVFDGQFENKEQSADEKIPETQQTDCEECDKCENCKYKQYFYANQNDDNANETFETECVTNEELTTHSDLNDNKITYNLKQNFDTDDSPSLFEEKLDNVSNKNLNEQIETQTENEQNLNDAEFQDSDAKIPTILESLLPQFDYIFKNYNQNEELTKLIPNSKFVAMDENGENYSLGAIYEDDKMKYICYAVKCNYNTPAPEELGKYYQWLPINSLDPLSEGYYLVYQDANDLKIIEV